MITRTYIVLFLPLTDTQEKIDISFKRPMAIYQLGLLNILYDLYWGWRREAMRIYGETSCMICCSLNLSISNNYAYFRLYCQT
jgi:hypothetical protein